MTRLQNFLTGFVAVLFILGWVVVAIAPFLIIMHFVLKYW